MLKTDIFWTDIVQATDRLIQSVILYDDEPYYVRDIVPGPIESPTPRAELLKCGVPRSENKTVRKILNSPKFERFRHLPNLGWMNYMNDLSVGAIYIRRRTTAGSRLHGLSNGNTQVLNIIENRNDNFNLETNNFNLLDIINDEGFVQLHKGIYPTLKQILFDIKEKSSIAYNRDFCIYRDKLGLRWLLYGQERIGLFTGIDTLNLFRKYTYLRETIMEDPTFTLNNIVEF